MKRNWRKAISTMIVGAALLTGAVLTAAAPANAATPTVFDLNGIFSDGGSARPAITNVNDILTVNMSSQHRPTATGVVLATDRIIVSFPDDTTYTAILQAPGTIRWSNGSVWTKTKPVPNLIGMSPGQANTAINAAGFTIGLIGTFPDPSCQFLRVVGRQNPGPGAPAIPGSPVGYSTGVRVGNCQVP
ncbi:hypothetical protein F4553_002217 [Allocatelliglobosispora scoriae]|uniref:PASTA domain-containing protein n=1 Tax=Allocatelliglobosispora scoriae TaxID=643052 RepID=A0A841BN81_9ACTN|nr:PASTA domain-containing protein [Allocatelliglobosispora scoriae]MBB5868838.1 hypothetical protein [Allocatelliglobosispora scoriae]